MERIKRDFADGKYTLIREPDGRMYALRYDEYWRNLVGDNLIYYMLMRITDLEEENRKLHTELMEEVMRVNKMAVEPAVVTVGELDRGEAFEHIGSHYMRAEFTSRVSVNPISANPNVRLVPVIRLDNGEISMMAGNMPVTRVEGEFVVKPRR